ncbi:MAG: hypothetical protein KJZ77_17560 [Anaerolineales bacterium]|nr:hypothetical protein [Anaerolineales bacterium]
MNISKAITISMTVILISVLIAACATPTEAPSSQEGVDVQVDEITDTEIVEQIVQTRLYNQCDSSNPLAVQMQFSESVSEAKQSELALSGTVGGEVSLSAVAKAQLQMTVQQKFASIYTAENGYLMKFDFVVPAQKHQEFTLVWREVRREGVINYMENGESKSANYSYRVGLEFEASNTKDVGCPTPTPAPEGPPTAIPTETPIPIPDEGETSGGNNLSDACIYTGTWGVYSSDPEALGKISHSTDGCYNLGAIGIFPDKGGVLRVHDKNQKIRLTHGIYVPIENDSVIEFKVFVNSMYLVYPENPMYVSFAVAPANDPFTAKNSARFRLWLDTVGSDSIITFRLANVGDANGYRYQGQRYEFGRTYTIRFELTGNIMRVLINGNDIKESLKIPTDDKVFYIGYHLPVAAGIDVSIKDVMVDDILR